MTGRKRGSNKMRVAVLGLIGTVLTGCGGLAGAVISGAATIYQLEREMRQLAIAGPASGQILDIDATSFFVSRHEAAALDPESYFVDLDTGFAAPAGLIRVLFIRAVEGLCQYPGNRGLAHPAQSGEEKSVPDTARADGVSQCPGHMFLSDYLLKGGWAILPGKNEIGHGWGHSLKMDGIYDKGRPEPTTKGRDEGQACCSTRWISLPLLPSGPGGILGPASLRAWPSTHKYKFSPRDKFPGQIQWKFMYKFQNSPTAMEKYIRILPSFTSPFFAMQKMAEREGFEPSIHLVGVYALSKRAPSASRTSLLLV